MHLILNTAMVISCHTVANRQNQVNTARKLGSPGSNAAGIREQLRHAAYVYTGTISHWYE